MAKMALLSEAKCTLKRSAIYFASTHARFALANLMPRLCPDAVGSASVNGLPTRNRLSEPHREAIGRSSGNIKHV